jgi:hypothetical protein
MALPPLPQGAVFIEDNGLPPLPTGAKFVSSDPSVPTIMSEEEQKAAEKKYRDYESSFGHRAGQFAEEGLKMLEGIPVMGAEAQIGQAAIPYLINKVPVLEEALSKIPNIKNITSSPLYKKTAQAVEPITEKLEPIVETVSDVASKAGEKIKEVPSKFLGWTSRTNPESLKTAYRIGKEGDKELLKAFKTGKELELDDYSQMIYNYARKLGLPHEEALKATHYRQDLETGAWNLWNKFKNQNPLGLPGWDKASDAQKLKMAEQAGFDVSSILPTKKNAKAMLGVEGGLGYLASMTPWLKSIVNAKMLPLLGFQSPRVAGELAYRAGQTRRVVPTILKGTKDIPTPALLGGLNYMGLTDDSED